MQHITLGWGRDFGDISPVRGVLTGGDEHSLSVAVDVVAKGECEVDPSHAGLSILRR
jgi:transglutaminase-like putative cysteine protease